MQSQLTHTPPSPELLNRRHPLLSTTTTPTPPHQPPPPSKKPSPNVREFAGGTTANIFVVLCCCPCGLAKCLVQVPVNVVRRIWRKRRRVMTVRGGGGGGGGGGGVHGEGYFEELSEVAVREVSGGGLMTEEMDGQLWDQFNETGFWRTTSQRHTVTRIRVLSDSNVTG